MKEYILDGNYVDNLDDLGQEIAALAEDGEIGALAKNGEITKKARKTILKSRLKLDRDHYFANLNRILDWVFYLHNSGPAILRVRNSKRIFEILDVNYNIKDRSNILDWFKKHKTEDYKTIVSLENKINDLKKNNGPGLFEEILGYIKDDCIDCEPNYPLEIILE